MTNTRNTLQSAEKTKLTAILVQTWDSYIMTRKPTYQQAGEHYTRQLGFPVTESNVEGIVEQLGREWPNRNPIAKTDSGSGVVVVEKLNEILDRLDRLETLIGSGRSSLIAETVRSNGNGNDIL